MDDVSIGVEFLFQIMDGTHDLVFFDVGSFEGIFCMLADRIPDLQVYAFEPHPLTFKRLRGNVEQAESPNVQIFEIAVWNECGEATLKQPPTDNTDEHGLSTLGRPKRFGNAVRYPVKTITLDAFAVEQGIKKLDFLKVDTEGAELMVLQGARGLIDKHRPAFLMEMREGNTTQCGYRIKSIYDFLFKRDYHCCSAHTGRDWYFWWHDEHRPRRGE